MAFVIKFTPTASDHVRAYRKFEQQIILEGIEEHLLHEPTVATRNRKWLAENPLADWELRIGRFRVFYDVVADEEQPVVKIKAVGHKEHNTLFIGSKEVQL
jgi:mRNA-degrading endonuclease RelE of RelBE toxin-antitoxin system